MTKIVFVEVPYSNDKVETAYSVKKILRKHNLPKFPIKTGTEDQFSDAYNFMLSHPGSSFEEFMSFFSVNPITPAIERQFDDAHQYMLCFPGSSFDKFISFFDPRSDRLHFQRLSCCEDEVVTKVDMVWGWRSDIVISADGVITDTTDLTKKFPADTWFARVECS